MEEPNQSNSLSEDEIVTIAYITTKIDRQLRAIRKKYKSPKDYSKSITKLFSHKDSVVALSLLYNIGNLDPNVLYKPEDLRKIANRQFQDAANNNLEIDYRDMNRALKELDKEIGLEHFDTKETIRQIQRVKFSGSPSAYKMPNEVSILKTVSSKPILSQLIIKSLRGLVDHLAFLLEGSFYLLTSEELYKDIKENTKHLFISAAKSSPFIELKEGQSYESCLEDYVKSLSSVDNEMIPKLAKEMAAKFVEIPELCYPILISFLSKTA